MSTSLFSATFSWIKVLSLRKSSLPELQYIAVNVPTCFPVSDTICILREGSFMLGTALFVNLIQLQDMVKINKRCNSEPSELYLFCLFIFSVWSKAYAALSSHESMWQYVQKLCHLPAQWKDIGNQIPCAFIIFFLFFPYLQREDLNL